jgi:hypothetical protein
MYVSSVQEQKQSSFEGVICSICRYSVVYLTIEVTSAMLTFDQIYCVHLVSDFAPNGYTILCTYLLTNLTCTTLHSKNT